MSNYKWKSLHHNGVIFPPKYLPHYTPIIYKGDLIRLDPKAEEFATLYAKYTNTDYIKSSVFRKNFWKDWKKILGKTSPIKVFGECDFNLIYKHILKKKEIKANLTKEQKKLIKKRKEEIEKKYKFALVNGKEQPVGNFYVEPPGIFIGRGCNPKLGKIKKRIYPEDITINISKDAKIPETLPGHKWGEIIHDRTVEWLASWKDQITGKTKYVWLAAKSDIKGISDMKKYDKARKLKKKIGKIRKKYSDDMLSDDIKIKQLATALYLIDNFALRIGNEKGANETDTVGVVSLRIEHIELLKKNRIKLDFLGKDSVKYDREAEIDENAYKNIENFMKNKYKSDQLFDKITTTDLNEYLKQFMKNLTSKMFRTYNASNLFQNELAKISRRFENYDEDDKINKLLDEFNKANLKVALLCNHRREVSKNFNKQIDKINQQIKKIRKKKQKIKKSKLKKKKERMEKINKKIKQLKVKKQLKMELKNLSLGTSKINYIDPRITIAFMKKHNISVDKIFSKTLQDKFKWAFNTPVNYKF